MTSPRSVDIGERCPKCHQIVRDDADGTPQCGCEDLGADPAEEDAGLVEWCGCAYCGDGLKMCMKEPDVTDPQDELLQAVKNVLAWALVSGMRHDTRPEFVRLSKAYFAVTKEQPP